MMERDNNGPSVLMFTHKNPMCMAKIVFKIMLMVLILWKPCTNRVDWLRLVQISLGELLHNITCMSFGQTKESKLCYIRKMVMYKVWKNIGVSMLLFLLFIGKWGVGVVGRKCEINVQEANLIKIIYILGSIFKCSASNVLVPTCV